VLNRKQGVSQAFLECWYVCSGYMGRFRSGSNYECGNICLDQVSLAYPVENLSVLVVFSCV